MPERMKAVVLETFTGPEGLTVCDLEVPKVLPGEVLIKIAAAPINPSDLIFLRNQYGVSKRLPVIPGFEGAGRVVAGYGVRARALVGRKVACRAPENGNGTWAEYMACPATACIPLLGRVSEEQGACLIVNPLTAWALLNIAKQEGSPAFVQTAAASALGQMLFRLARRAGMTAINIVRRPAQVDMLKQAGSLYVLDSSAEGFADQLQILCRQMKARIAFDAVGGPLTAQIVDAMPQGSKVIVYGALSGADGQFSPHSLIFGGKVLKGFWLSDWVKHRTLLQNLWMAYQVQKRLDQDLKTHVHARFPLAKIREAIEIYKRHRSEGKVLLIP